MSGSRNRLFSKPDHRGGGVQVGQLAELPADHIAARLKESRTQA
jgi:hypothetical protein